MKKFTFSSIKWMKRPQTKHLGLNFPQCKDPHWHCQCIQNFHTRFEFNYAFLSAAHLFTKIYREAIQNLIQLNRSLQSSTAHVHTFPFSHCSSEKAGSTSYDPAAGTPNNSAESTKPPEDGNTVNNTKTGCPRFVQAKVCNQFRPIPWTVFQSRGLLAGAAARRRHLRH